MSIKTSQITLTLMLLICFSLQSMESTSTKALDEDLISALRENKLLVAKQLLDRGASPQATNDFHRTALHYAAALGAYNIAECLIERGADATLQDAAGRTPLHWAALAGEAGLVHLLLKHKAPRDIEDTNGHTALSYAIKLGEEEIAQTLIRWGAQLSQNTRRTAFLDAAQKGHHGIIALLKKGNSSKKALLLALKAGNLEWIADLFLHGAEVNTPFKSGRFPLHYAADNGHSKTAQFLIGQGAALWALDGNEETPLDIAKKKGHSVLVELFDNQAKLNHELIKATKKGEMSSIQALLKKGAQVSGCTASWATPLHVACATGNEKLVRLLLKNNADINAHDSEGSTPLHWATGSTNPDIIQLLCDSSVDTESCDNYGYTALHWAARAGVTDMVRKLIESGAEINRPASDGKTPLYLAAEAGESKTAHLLLARGGKLNPYDLQESELFYTPPNGHTIQKRLKAQVVLDEQLFKAAKRGSLITIKALLARGARVNARDTLLRTPLHYAAQKGYLKIVSLLLDHGARVRVYDTNKATPMSLAAARNFREIVELLENHNPLHRELFKAVKENSLERAEELLKKGAQVQARNYNEETPLHIAVSLGLEKMVDLLLLYNANLHATDSKKRTVQDRAREKTHRGIMRRLKDQQQKDEELFKVIVRGNIRKIEPLLTKGARIMARNCQQRTPLHYACFYGHIPIVSLLLKHGADPEARDEQGHTPIALSPSGVHRKLWELFG